MQSVDTEVDGGALAGLDNLFLDLVAHLGYNLFDTCGVYTAVGYQLMQGEARDFAAHGVEAREYDCLGGVVDYDLNACCSFESTDVAALAAYDAALDLVGIDVEHGN